MSRAVLFCSDTFWNDCGEHVVAIDPTVEPIRLVGDEHVTQGDIDRITVAYYSPDLWPDRARAFLGVGLRAPRLEWLQSMMAGTDAPEYAQLRSRGVTVTSAVGATAPTIAQSVMLYLLAFACDLPRLTRAQAQRRWEPGSVVDLDGKHLAIVGMGSIGSAVARVAQPFGMRCIGLRRTVRGDEPCETWTTHRLHELLAWADAVVLAAPLNDETRGMIDGVALAAMRPGTWFVNVGRGECVDEDALVDALRSDRLAGAGLDVFATEPLPSSSALWTLPNVIVTPHSSSTSALADRRINELFVDNFTRWRRGEPLRNVVD
jgi:D-2-hydroxyacid dehydrogenase (NADP+)